jgi:DNA-binding response OmpR family regulator
VSSSWYERLVGIATAEKTAGPREILVIDDHAEVREMIVTLLSRLGWQTRQAATGAEALSAMATARGTVALALVDVILPDTDGMSLSRQLRAEYPRLEIVLLSGQLNDESRWVVTAEGFRFLPKPFNLTQLRDVVAGVLGDADEPQVG